MVKSIRSIVIVLLVLTIIIGLQGAVFAANDEVTSLLLEGDSIIGDTPGNNVPANNNAGDGGILPGNGNVLPGGGTPAGNNLPVFNTQANNPPANNNQRDIPQAGESDIYIVTLLIVLCGAVTVYAYKKIRDYNGL